MPEKVLTFSALMEGLLFVAMACLVIVFVHFITDCREAFALVFCTALSLGVIAAIFACVCINHARINELNERIVQHIKNPKQCCCILCE